MRRFIRSARPQRLIVVVSTPRSIDNAGLVSQALLSEVELITTRMALSASFRHRHSLRVVAAYCIFQCAVGCSNEFMNSAIYSDRTRIEKFREYHDREIGEPYYGRKAVVCEHRSCSSRSDGWLEITHDGVFEEGCTIVWLVEPSPTGKYPHQNGLILDILGIKRAWRYVSEPSECLYGLDWEGPW